MAPLYGRGEAENVMGLAFADGYPDDLRLTTKCMLGTAPAPEVLPRFEASLDKSCERMHRPFIDLFILHGYVVPDGFDEGPKRDVLARVAVPYSLYCEAVVPAMLQLKEEGRIGAWGMTAAGPQSTNLKVLDPRESPPVPDTVQCIANLLDTPGGMVIDGEPPRPRQVIAAARQAGVGVMGIRAVAAGSLTAAIDREMDPTSPEMLDFARAEPFRSLAAGLGESAASLAHRYALSMHGVDTVVLGVKNRDELYQCLAAEAAGALSSGVIDEIDRLAAG